MKKVSRVKDSKKQDLSEDSEPDYHQQYVKHDGTRSLVDISDEYQNYLQIKNRFIHRYNDSDSDCMQKVEYNKKNKEVCGYCRKEKHSLNDCPLFTTALQQQSNMLCTYNISSTNHLKQSDHFTHYDESEMSRQHHELWQKAQREYFRKHGNSDNETCNGTDQQHLKFLQKAQREYFRKHGNSDTETCNGTDQQHLKFLQKAQEEYYSKHCKYCNEYGHRESNCTVLEKAALKHSDPEDDWRDTKTKKSNRSKKNKVLKAEVHDLSEIDHDASDCTKETKENYLSKFCHYCKEYGHIENICPLVQKSLKKQKGKQTTVLPKIHKKDNLASAMSKVKDFRKLKACNFCGNFDHKEDDCVEKNQFIKKHRLNFKEQVQLKDMCPSLEEDVRKLEKESHKFYLDGQMITSNSNDKIKYKHVKTLNKCNFCGDPDHSESECEEKLQYEYISKYCHYCEEYGHFEDTCPLVEAAARAMEDGTPKSSKKVSFANDVTTLTENLVDLKICPICDEFGHNEDNCFVKEQAEFYSKYCAHCDRNGHNEKDCELNKAVSNRSAVSSIILKRELEFKTSTAYASICSDHCVCDSCHNVYSLEHNSSESEGCTSKNVRKTTLQSPIKAKANRLRYCTLCGIEGLIDTCFLKEKAATK